MHPYISVARWKPIYKKHLHALVDHLTPPLILQPGFCQVNREDTCNANNASDSSINEFGGEAAEINK